MPYDLSTYQEEKASGRRSPSGALNLTRLTGRHLRVVNLHLSGLKGYEIARVMNLTEGRISNILNDPLVKTAIQARFVETDNEMFAKATKVIDEKMDSEDPAIALRAADMVYRARGRYEKRPDDRPTAEDVVQRMLELAKTNGRASVTISAGVGPTPSRDPFLELEPHER